MAKATRKQLIRPVKMVDTLVIISGLGIEEVSHKREKSILVQKEKGEKLVHLCSKSYELVPLGDILPDFEKGLKTIGSYESAYMMFDDCIFYMDYSFTESVFMIGKGRYKTNDAVIPMIRIGHSYNGWIKFRLTYGYLRLSCSNPLSIYDYNGGFQVKHTEQLANGQAFKMCEEAIEQFIEQSKVLWKTYDQLANKIVKQYEERIIEITANVPGVPKKEEAQDSMKAMLLADMATLQVEDADEWLIYNAINRYINHSSGSDVENKIKVDQKLLNYIVLSSGV